MLLFHVKLLHVATAVLDFKGKMTLLTIYAIYYISHRCSNSSPMLECQQCGLRKLDLLINGSIGSVASCHQQSSAVGLDSRLVCSPGLSICPAAAFSRHRGAMLCHSEGHCSPAMQAVGGCPATYGSHDQPDGPVHRTRSTSTKSQAQ